MLQLKTYAKFTGNSVSAKLGDIFQLKTSFSYKCFESRVSRDNKFNINNYNDMVKEILFWKFNITNSNNKYLANYHILHVFFPNLFSVDISFTTKII